MANRISAHSLRILARLRPFRHPIPRPSWCFVTTDSGSRPDASRVRVHVEKQALASSSKKESGTEAKQERSSSCGDLNDDEMEPEEMFVDAHESFEHQIPEWGGPRRGGRLPEPTRFGDWERKGRCSDF